jgi:hypothetical protein
MSEQNDQIIACNPAAIHPDEREAHGLLAKKLFSSSTILETRELTDGYGFRFPLDTPMLHKAVKWIANERLCCPFFTFTMIVDEQLWIELSGTEGVKELIKLELLPMLESGDFPTLDELQVIYDEASNNSNS